MDVIVGAPGGDTISASAISGNIGAATPTFILGGAGNDTLNAAGMTGSVWFVGGGGADKMTAGTGAATFIYDSVADSTATTMDLISGFIAATDKIDLTGLGLSLTVAGSINSNGKNGALLSSDSVGWQTSGGNTFVYVNTSGGKESTALANMKIELSGSIPLASGSIVHL